MNLIDYTFFIGNLFIAQKAELSVRERIDLYIKRKQKEFLTKLLGEELYEEFIQGLSQAEPAEKWLKLRDLLVDQDLKLSPIANYVYCSILEDDATENTGIGVVATEGENSSKASPVYKIVDAWNRMVKAVCEIHKEIKSSSEYPNYKYKDRACICETRRTYCGCHKAVFEYRNTLGL